MTRAVPRGEVLLGGPTVAAGYLVDAANPDEDVVAKNRDDFVTIGGVRYFCTGDVGQVTAAGTLQVGGSCRALGCSVLPLDACSPRAGRDGAWF